VEFTILQLQDSSGAIVAMVAIMRDVTKRFQEIRELKQKLVELSGTPTR
jgi:signal transduction histidine kinase